MKEKITYDVIYACGPKLMYKSLYDFMKNTKLNIFVSLEERMGCGFGVCLSCAIKTVNGMKQICKDGPVFKIDDIIWD